jgi:hypothetical protein
LRTPFVCFGSPENGQKNALAYNKRTKINGQNNVLGFYGVQKQRWSTNVGFHQRINLGVE